MASKIKELTDKGLMNPPKWLPDNMHYETIMGSFAYGVSSDLSDCDIYGFCIPAREEVFPHLKGYIMGFEDRKHPYKQWPGFQQHHVFDEDALGGKGRNHDFNIYGIVRYFSLCMENNPNMIDSLFTSDGSCVLHMTKIGRMVRESRKLFLHRGCWHTFKGYAHEQVKKMGSHDRVGKRKELIETYGFDVKFAYHVVRLMNECEQILTEKDIDLMRNNDQLKAIRRGEWTEKQIREYFDQKEKALEDLYNKSDLPWGPTADVEPGVTLQSKIKQLLVNCLEEHYGSLSKTGYQEPDAAIRALREIDAVIDRYRDVLSTYASKEEIDVVSTYASKEEIDVV